MQSPDQGTLIWNFSLEQTFHAFAYTPASFPWIWPQWNAKLQAYWWLIQNLSLQLFLFAQQSPFLGWLNLFLFSLSIAISFNISDTNWSKRGVSNINDNSSAITLNLATVSSAFNAFILNRNPTSVTVDGNAFLLNHNARMVKTMVVPIYISKFGLQSIDSLLIRFKRFEVRGLVTPFIHRPFLFQLLIKVPQCWNPSFSKFFASMRPLHSPLLLCLFRIQPLHLN